MEKKSNRIESKYTVEHVASVLARYYGLISPSARELGCSRQGLYKYINRHPDIKKTIRDGRENLIDSAESILCRVIEGSLQSSTSEKIDAAKYLLSTIGSSRGYTTKSRIDITSEDEPIRPVINFVKKTRNV